MASDKDLQDLANAAKLKLQKQKEEQDKDSGGDIYADIRNEAAVEEYDSYPTLKPAPNGPMDEMPSLEDDTDYNVENPIDEDDYQIYENGPFKSQVDIWKKEFGEGHVLHTQILERHFVFKTLNRYEYKQLIALENVDALMREELICSTCVLHPRKYNFKAMATQEAGYPGTLAQIIMEASGFTQEYGIEVL